MIFSIDATLDQLSIHRVGNKSTQEPLVLSDRPFFLTDDLLKGLLLQYFTGAFAKVEELYRFDHSTGDLSLNEVFHFAREIFRAPGDFHVNSRQLATYLYDSAGHPNIKPGEFYVAYFRDLQIEGEMTDAIGLFKSENKETYLKVAAADDGFDVSYEQEAINIRKLDKGCLIFNQEEKKGYKVAVIDLTNKVKEAVYWVDDFLKLKARNGTFLQTNTVLKVYKDFVTDGLDDIFEVSRPDKIDLLNRSIKYFKENDSFDLDGFSQEVLANENGIQAFKNFKSKYETEYGTPIPDSFSISDAAVKKQARAYKSVLKLDKNFHIYIHGNKELIERGFDEGMNMHFYKVYFNQEQ